LPKRATTTGGASGQREPGVRIAVARMTVALKMAAPTMAARMTVVPVAGWRKPVAIRPGPG
jgi:hypothetical protein